MVHIIIEIYIGQFLGERGRFPFTIWLLSKSVFCNLYLPIQIGQIFHFELWRKYKEQIWNISQSTFWYFPITVSLSSLHPEMQHFPSDWVFKINPGLSASSLCHLALSSFQVSRGTWLHLAPQLIESYLPLCQSGTQTQTQKMSLSLLQFWNPVYRLPQTQQQLFEGGRVLGRVNPFLFTRVCPTHPSMRIARFLKAGRHRRRLIFSTPPILKDWTFSVFVLTWA